MNDQDRFILLASLWIVYTFALLLIIWVVVSAHFYANAPNIYRSTDSTQRSVKNLVGRGLTWADREHHSIHRQALAPMFSSFAVEGFCPIFADTVQKVQDVWEKALKSRQRGMIVDVQHWMNSVVQPRHRRVRAQFCIAQGRLCTVTAAFYTLRAPPTNSLSDIIFRLASIIPILRNIPTAKNRIIKDFQAYIAGVAKDVLERNASKGVVEDKSILGLLIKSLAENPAGEFRLSHAEVTAQIVSVNLPGEHRIEYGLYSTRIPCYFLVGAFECGFETTLWLLVELAKNKAIQDKLRHELRQVCGNFGYSEILKLPYLHTVVDEALRLHPPIADTTRVAIEDDVIPLSSPILTKFKETVGSIHVAKGTVVTAPIQYINTSETFWGPGALKFDPGRWWQDKSNDNFPGNRHLAFGDGPRTCIAADFSLALIKVVVYGVVSNFMLSLPEGPQTIIESTGRRIPQPRVAGRASELSMVVRSVKQHL
ncbi:cytochrome P450 [Mycena galopus ATCC 62051]|nr:cytochrome P450 [Mycena galopus ATCC 62051]